MAGKMHYVTMRLYPVGDTDGKDVNIYREEGEIYLKIDCQRHTLETWKNQGADIIAKNLIGDIHGITQTELLDSMTGDDEKDARKIADKVRRVRIKEAAKLHRLQAITQQLNFIIEYAEKAMKYELKREPQPAQQANGKKPNTQKKATAK